MNEYEMYLSGLSICEINEKTKIPKSTLRFKFNKKGILRNRTDGIRIAAQKGKLSHMKGKTRIFTKEWKENIRKGKLKHGQIYAKGWSLKPSGYIEITRGPNKGRYQHDVIVELHIGRKLYSNECVHHINKDTTDNRIENLQLLTISEHTRLHRKMELPKKRDEKGRFI